MKAQLLALRNRFDALSLRERLLILVTLVVLVVLPPFLYGIEPDQKALQRLQSQVSTLKAEVANKQLELVTLKSNPKPDPNVLLRRQIERLQEKREQINQELATRSAQLISPREMVGVLQAALSQQPGLQLIKAEKGEARRFEGGENPELSGLYRHDLSLTVSGGFFEVLAYLRTLESLPRGFFWDGLDYRVSEYPKAEVTLRLHTLSTEAGWLGV